MSIVSVAAGLSVPDAGFPVGGWLLAPRLRPHVSVFCRFVRAAAAVVEDPKASVNDTLRRLHRMAEVLDGDAPVTEADAPAAAMAESLRATQVSSEHCHDLLQGFRQDATKSRYDEWDELLNYGVLAAAPAGRHLLDLHGEDRRVWPAADSLCVALQVLNHVRRCGEDYRLRDRVYLPLDHFRAADARVEMLGEHGARPPLRRVLGRMVAEVRPLLVLAKALPGQVADDGLRRESAVVVALAERLTAKLARHDPLRRAVGLGRGDVAVAGAVGLTRAWLGAHP